MKRKTKTKRYRPASELERELHRLCRDWNHARCGAEKRARANLTHARSDLRRNLLGAVESLLDHSYCEGQGETMVEVVRDLRKLLAEERDRVEQEHAAAKKSEKP